MMKRIAVVTPTLFRYLDTARSTINIEYYVHALRELGHDASIVAPEGSECSAAVDWMAVDLPRYRDPEFWKSLHLDAVVFFTWMSYVEELHAMREAGLTIISRADTGGDNSFRVFPAAGFDFMVRSQATRKDKIRSLKHWLDCYFRLYKQQDARVIASAEEAHAIAIETTTAKDRLARVFAYHGHPKLAQKIVVCPHLLSQDILNAQMAERKAQKIVAIGRWKAFQKDGPLLYSALKLHFEREPATKIVIIGGDGEEVFGSLREGGRDITCTGNIPRAEIQHHLADAQVLALSSRYESFHIAAHEALCLGCTVVGPEVIPMQDICAAGDFGIMTPQRKPALLADAMTTEIGRWRDGKRNAQGIADFWRDRLQPTRIMERMLGAAGIDRAVPQPAGKML